MSMMNEEVARLFRELADLLELRDENPFRIRAYRTAARSIEELPQPIEELARDPARLTALEGIGADLAGKIGEIVRTGRLAALDRLARGSAPGQAELLALPGLGPRRVRRLETGLGIRSAAQLRRALRQGKVRGLPGFGAKTEARLLAALEARAAAPARVLLPVAMQYAEALAAHLRAVEGVTRVELAGSCRRGRETVGDLDLLAAGRDRRKIVAAFTSWSGVREVLAAGPTRAAVRLRSGLQVDLRVLPEASWGAGLYYFTGSRAHNIAVRRRARQRGLKLNEYGVFRGSRRVAGRTEEDVFAAVGLPWIPPELREDRGEIAAAEAGRLPRLVEPKQLRGDLQCHTTDSDGRDTLQAMAEAAEARGYEYLAVTDHSPAVRVAGGLDRAGFRRQRRRIDRLNAKLRRLTVLAGAEVDILADGSLDLDDDTLAGLDLVVISLHSRLALPAADQTRRVLRALRHPSADILGHPTARLIGRRPPAAFDFAAVCRAAAEQGIMLEVNAQPERLDLDDVGCRAALAHGAMLTISTDAHSTAELDCMRWGVWQARRGWVEARHVANTRPLQELLPLLHATRRH